MPQVNTVKRLVSKASTNTLTLRDFDHFIKQKPDSPPYLLIPREVEDALEQFIGQNPVVDQALSMSACSVVGRLWADFIRRVEDSDESTPYVTISEFIAEGYRAALLATSSFDPGRGKFIPYAQAKIKFAIKDLITRDKSNRATGKMLSTSSVKRFHSGSSKLSDELRDQLDLITEVGGVLSLDKVVDEDDENEVTLGDTLIDDDPDPSDIVTDRESWGSAHLDLVLEDLGIAEKDQLVLRHYLGLGGRQVLSLRKTADHLGVARGTVRASLERTAPMLRADMTFDELEAMHRSLLDRQGGA